MAFLDHLGMTCQWPTWRSRNLDSETPVPRQVRWFFRPATHISSRSDHLHWHHCQKVTDILTSWWFQTVLIFTTWTDDLFLTRIFQMFFCSNNYSSVQTSLWGGGFLGDGSWSRSSHEWYSSTRFGPKVEGFLAFSHGNDWERLGDWYRALTCPGPRYKKNDIRILNSYRYTCRP